MSEYEIKVADAILAYGSLNKEMPLNYFTKFPKNSDMPDALLNYVGKYLEDSGHIKLTKNGDEYLYRLESTGHDLARFKKSYSGYLMEEAEKKTRQLEKDEREDETKDLQRKDLHFKVHKLNPAQYESYADLWKRHWMVIAVPLAAFIILWLTFMFKK